MRFFLQNAAVPLPREGTFEVRPGFVFKLRTVGLQRIEVPTFEEAIRDPYWARDLEVQGLPQPADSAGKLLVFAPTDCRIFDFKCGPTIPQLHQVVCDVFDLDSDGNMLIFARRAVVNTAYCGEPIDRMAAVVPKDWVQARSQYTGVFIDARELGQGLFFHAFGTRSVRTKEILALIDVNIPADLIVKIAGTDGSEGDDDDVHCIAQGSILTLWTAAGDSSESASESMTEATVEDSEPRNVWRRPFDLAASIFSFQCQTQFLKISIIPEDDAESVIEELNFMYHDEHPRHTLCPVRPQPCLPYIAVLTECTWTQAQALCAIMVDAMPVGGRCFQIFCGRDFCRQDIADALESDWNMAFHVYAEDSGAVEGDRRYIASSGMLVTVYPMDGERPAYSTLEQRLQHPEIWVPSDLSGLFQEEVPREQGAVLLGESSSLPIIDLPDLSSWSDVRSIAAQALGIEDHALSFATPSRQLPGLTIRGHLLPQAIGFVQAAQSQPYGVFVDPRDLGMGIAYVQRETCTANVAELLDAAGATYCHDVRLQVHGALLYTPCSGTVTFGHRSVLTITVDRDDFEDERVRMDMDTNDFDDRACNPEDDSDANDSGIGGGDHQGQGLARSRSPRRAGNVTHSGVDPNRECCNDDIVYAFPQHPHLVLTTAGATHLKLVAEKICNGPGSRDGSTPKATDINAGAGLACNDGTGSSHAPRTNVLCLGHAEHEKSQRLHVSLNHALPAVTFNCDVQCLRFVETDVAGCWNAILTPWHGFRPSRCIAHGQVHEHTQAALMLCDDSALGEAPRGLQIYTDGSEKDGSTGWAVVITQTSSTGAVAFVGYFGGAVVTDADAGDFLGARHQGSREAGITAIGWAILWLLGHWDLLWISQVTIHFDCTSAGFAASGDWHCGQDTLAEKVRHLVQISESRFGGAAIEWKHVKGHSGHPWNEMADSAASWFRSGLVPEVHVASLSVDLNLGKMDLSRLHLCTPMAQTSKLFPKLMLV